MTPCTRFHLGRSRIRGSNGNPFDCGLHKEIFRSGGGSRGGCGGWPCQVAPMTNHRGPLTDLISTLAMHCRHGGSEQTMHRLRAGGVEVDGATTLSELAAQCNRTHDRARAEDILRSLVGLAGDDGLAALGALVALYPALLGIARRLIVTGVTLEQADVSGLC